MNETTQIQQRAFSIHIDNPLEGTPTCTFQQEKVVVVDGETIKQPIGELVVPFDPTDPNAMVLYDLLKNYYLELIKPPVVVETTAEDVPPPPAEGVV